MLTVILSSALLCFAPNDCVPALIGKNTPTGIFPLQQYRTNEPGFGGDVVVFHQDRKLAYAIHRVWTLKPKERRLERLASPQADDNQNVTLGCVNVLPADYERVLAAMRSDSTVLITK